MKYANREIKLLRIYGKSSNISADVFDDLFRENIGTLFSTEYMTSLEFASIFSDRSCLSDLLNNFDYICPDYKMMPAVPWMMQFRNQNHLSFGIIFITHSPGIYGTEWYLMRELICPKDIIIAPSYFSGSVISLFAPSLESNIEVISHPIDLKKNHIDSRKRGSKIVTLTRIVEDKLIHRQIDAMGLIVHKYGYDHLKMFIGGSLRDSENDELTHYARLLKYKIKLLNLKDNVFLTGEISGAEKKEFFMDSFVSVNLSKTLEEAFPKASVEALSFGIPVVSTLWNGFKETVGSAGLLLKIIIDAHGKADVDKDELARAIIRMYDDPVPEDICLQQIEKYDFSILREKYLGTVTSRSTKSTKIAKKITEKPGLLDTISFLKVFTHGELMGYHSEWVEIYFKNIINNNSMPVQTSEIFFRAFIPESLNEILTGFYSFKYSKEILDGFNSSSVLNDSKEPNDFREKMRRSIYISNNTHSKKTLLKIFSERPDPELLKEAILHFEKNGGDIPLWDYYLPFSDFLAEKYSEVCAFYCKHYMSLQPELNQADKLCLWSRAAQKCNETKEIIQYMDKWLGLFITEPEATKVHIEYLKLLIIASDMPYETMNSQIDIINEICFDRTLAQKLEIMAYAR